MNQWLDVIIRAVLPRVVPLMVAALVGALATVGWLPPEVAQCVQGVSDAASAIR